MSKSDVEKDLTKIGEFGLIELLTSKIKLIHSESKLGVGDDAAIIDAKGKHAVVTTDLLTEGIHFDLMYTPLKHLGYKAIIVNLSDVYAMNAMPKQVLVSIAISNKFTTDMLEELYDGMHLACELYGVDMVGGDTSSSLTGMTITVTAIGMADEDKIVKRSGAKENDLICVTGDLGGAFLGLQLLEREKEIFNQTGSSQPDLSGYDYILERQLKPEAGKDLVEELDKAGILPTSMIDISDGLSSEILHICKASVCGCAVYADKIPVSDEVKRAAEDLNLEGLTIALSGGEDYELLFTVPVNQYDKIDELNGVSIIGHIKPKSEGEHLVLPDGSLVELSALGWNTFNEE